MQITSHNRKTVLLLGFQCKCIKRQDFSDVENLQICKYIRNNKLIALNIGKMSVCHTLLSKYYTKIRCQHKFQMVNDLF